jgi:hypothetical protein
MGKQIFIPMTDEILFDRPELISSPLRPFSQDLPCLHWLDIEINPSDAVDCLNMKTSEPIAIGPNTKVHHSKPNIGVAYPHFAAA